MKNRHYVSKYILLFLFIVSCKKSTFLDANPNQTNVVPSTLTDYEAILNNDMQMNGNGGSGLICSFGEAGADNYFDTNFAPLTSDFINLYTWNDDIYANPKYNWAYPYKCVYYANLVLDGLSKLKISSSEQVDANNAKGSALFFRAHMFYQLAQIFAPLYDSATAASDLGIPLRLGSDLTEKINRATVKETYGQIISDLTESLNLLAITPIDKNHPSKPAVYALLSRTYLSMRDYSHAALYADSCLQLQNGLMDYNSLNASGSYAIPQYNTEVILSSILITDVNSLLSVSAAFVDTNLVNSYNANDLRGTVFFGSGTGYKPFLGSYDGSDYYFAGLATDEIYLVRAECSARFGRVDSAMNDLNALLIKRWVTGTFVPYTAVSPADALQQILTERRKELLFRSLRWTDLRRLNKEGANITITRVVKGQTYTLAENSLHYTFLIPPDVMSLNPGMQQNPR